MQPLMFTTPFRANEYSSLLKKRPTCLTWEPINERAARYGSSRHLNLAHDEQEGEWILQFAIHTTHLNFLSPILEFSPQYGTCIADGPSCQAFPTDRNRIWRQLRHPLRALALMRDPGSIRDEESSLYSWRKQLNLKAVT